MVTLTVTYFIIYCQLGPSLVLFVAFPLLSPPGRSAFSPAAAQSSPSAVTWRRVCAPWPLLHHTGALEPPLKPRAHARLAHTRTRVRSFELMRRMQIPFFLFDYSVCRSSEERKKEKNALISDSVLTEAKINLEDSVHRAAPCLSSYSLSFALCSLMRRLE